MQRTWLTSRSQKGAPERRGHYRDQHQPEDLDPDLLMVEDHENSTQTVVTSRRPFLSAPPPLQLEAWHGSIHQAHGFYRLICGQNVDHAYYISKMYGPGDRAARELWVDVEKMGEEWKVRGFLSSAHRQAEVLAQQRIKSWSSPALRLPVAIIKSFNKAKGFFFLPAVLTV